MKQASLHKTTKEHESPRTWGQMLVPSGTVNTTNFRMRTTFTTLFVIAALLLGITKVQAQTSGTTGPLTWTVSSDSTTLTISGNGAMPDYEIGTWGPWADPFFEYLTTVVIEEGVTTIGNYAFYGIGLTSVTIPNSVTSIGELAFSYCTNLTSVNLPPDLTHIVMGAFFGCYKLASITLPEKVTSIGESAFYQCYSLTAITIPNSVTSLGKDAFNRCSSLASVTIGSGITSIGQGVFSYCTALASITIPSNITSIGHVAFRGCSSLCRVTIGSGVTRIEPLAFLECGALASIRVVSMTPPSVADFNGIDQTSCILKVPTGAAAAYRAAPLWQNFTTINEIEDVASGTAGTLTWVLTSDGTLTISGNGAMPDFSSTNLAPWSAYSSTINRVVIDDGVTSIGDAAFNLYAQSNYPLLSQVSIPNSVTRIGKYAFMFCKVLSTVTIPNSVTSIEYAAFTNCQALTSITIPNSVTSIADGVFESCKALSSVTIPNSLTSIGNYVFNNCQALTSITIPNSVTSIGDGAFSSCIKLESITIVSGVTVIGIGAFWNCSKLASVTIGSGVTYIDRAAFYNCSALTQLNVKAVAPPVIDNSTFTGVNSSCVLEVPFGSKNLYQTAMYWNYFTTINEITDPDLASSVVSASVASSTSITINGRITNSSTEGKSANYYFFYGTDPNNLNQTTAMQGVTVPGSGSLNVSTTITGLTNGTLYYYKLVAGGNESATGKLFLSTSIPASNLTLWLRSDQAVTSSSSSVSGWGDLSSSNNDASQSTSGNQPTITSSAINGYPALSFNGTTSKLTLPTSVSLGMQSNPYELFIVAKSSSGNIQFLLAGGANEQFEYHLNGVVGARFIPVTSVLIDQGTAGAYTNGNAHVFSARTSASGGVVRVDGNDVGTTGVSTLSSNSGTLLLGARSDNTYYFDGYIAEVIIYNANLSSADRNRVEQYLAERYQIEGMNMPEFKSTSFTIAEDTLFSGLLANDADGDALAYTIVANALHGTAHVKNDSLFYQPALNFNGADSLRIAVSDGVYSDTAWVHISVTPVNDRPVLSDLTDATTAEDTPFSGLLATDADGDALAYTLLANVLHGTAQVKNDSLFYQPALNFNGADSLRIAVSDGVYSDTAWVQISVTPVNDRPVARDTIITANTAKVITVSLPVSDVDGSISAVYIDRQPNNGVATVSGSSINYTSDAEFSGNDTLTWYVQDNEGALSNNATLIISVVPLLPIDLSVADSIIIEGSGACFNAENEIAVAGSSEVIVDNNASVSFIAGSSVRFLPGFHAVSGSYAHAWITTDGSFCDALPVSIVAVNPVEEKSLVEEQVPAPEKLVADMLSMKVYPNPNNGQFTISVSGAGEGQSDIRVYNIRGVNVYSGRIDNIGLNGITLESIAAGLYFVEITTGREKVSKRLVIID